MYRVRLHGRGGHGIKTGSRVLGSALFQAGWEVQDAPRYGAERRGAPIHATVRASTRRIHERGVIVRPDLVALTDETLLQVSSAGVLAGVDADTVLLLMSDTDSSTWRDRLRTDARIITLPGPVGGASELPFLGVTAAAAAAQLLGVIVRPVLDAAITLEVAAAGESAAVEESVDRAGLAWRRCEKARGCVREGREFEVDVSSRPAWIDVEQDPLPMAAPEVLGGPTSPAARTGAWRTMRPEVDPEHCRHCTWICTTFCPDAAITAGPDRIPEFDYDHCKGCLICVAVCPSHAIQAYPESDSTLLQLAVKEGATP
jgi:pyruvate ferredoxin oxidoreductase gamma subunit